MKILIAQINPTIGALNSNTDKIIHAIEEGQKNKVDIVLFPELALSGYPPQDLLLLPHFIDAVEKNLEKIIEASSDIIVIVGLPRRNRDLKEKNLFNSAAIIQNKKLIGYQDKSLLPTYDVFTEKRYFEPATSCKIWNLNGKKVAITICEDIWQHGKVLTETIYRTNPIEELIPQAPELILNLSASPFNLGKLEKNRLKVCSKAAFSLKAPLILCNQVGGNDSLIFDGNSLYMNSQGQLLKVAKGFEEDLLVIDLDEDIRPISINLNPHEQLFQALVLGLKDYFQKSGFKKACLGLSGGIDSATVACLAATALGPSNVLGIGMPSRYSSEGSKQDARKLAENLGIEYQEISIEGPFKSYLDLLAQPFKNLPSDVTEENLQARIRGMILMAFSNKFGYIVLSTGNKSELAMGYSTLYGDMCGGLAVISDVTKQQIYGLAHWINRSKEIIPKNTITKVPSAELRPNQTDQDTLPAYEIVDNVLQAYIEGHQSPEKIAEFYHYPIEIVQDLIKRIHKNEYKRRQSPPGLRISEKAFSEGRRFPIVERFIS